MARRAAVALGVLAVATLAILIVVTQPAPPAPTAAPLAGAVASAPRFASAPGAAPRVASAPPRATSAPVVAQAAADCASAPPARRADPAAAARREAARQVLEQQVLAQADPKLHALAVFLAPEGDRALQARRRDALASAAAASTDPSLYAMALRACAAEGHAQAGACQLLNARQWARLDAGNGVPWIVLAAEAQAHGDAAGVADAMHHAALAPRLDMRQGLFVELVDRVVPPDAPAALRDDALAWAARLESARALPPMQAALQFCRSDRLDANRRQTCEAFAGRLAQQGSTLTEVSVAAVLGRRLGWPAPRLAALQQERDAFNALVRLRSAGPGARCVQPLRDWWRDVAERGERAAARRAIERLGETPERLAADQRAWRAARAASVALSVPAAR